MFHVVSEFERLVIFSISGKYKGIRGPGFIFVNPLTERVKEKVDLREQPSDIDPQRCLTNDNVPLGIRPMVFYKITDPAKKVNSITDAEQGILDIARTTLRAIVGDLELTDVISRRESIAEELQTRISEQAERWGVEITAVEIEDIVLTESVEEAMSNRKAEIEEAEAKKRASILKAEGEHEAAQAEYEARVTRAEAQKKEKILESEAEREAQVRRAEGLSEYYQSLIDLGDEASIPMKFEHIDALRAFADSENTKLVLSPFEVLEGSVNSFGSLRFLEDTLDVEEVDGSSTEGAVEP